MNFDLLLDASNLRCPTPIIQTKSYISKLTKGQKLLVVVTEPSYAVDCQVFVRQSGHLLLHSWQEGEKFYFLMQSN